MFNQSCISTSPPLTFLLVKVFLQWEIVRRIHIKKDEKREINSQPFKTDSSKEEKMIMMDTLNNVNDMMEAVNSRVSYIFLFI